MSPGQHSLFGDGEDRIPNPPRPSHEPDLGEVREDLAAMLDEARRVTADSLWDERTYRYNKIVFPQMSRWLPEDEAQQLCFEFSRELERIEKLLAA